MAKCKFEGTPFYKVQVGNKEIAFNYFGTYETDNEEELKVLHELAPVYIKEVNHAEPKKEEKKAEKQEKTEEKKPKASKSSEK